MSSMSFCDFARASLSSSSAPLSRPRGLDWGSWHLLGRAEGGAFAGCLRLIPRPLRIGRVAVAAPLRRHGLARRLMNEALLSCREHHPGLPVALTAQTYLASFYRSFGFEAIGEPYDDFGLTHLDMVLRWRD